MVLERKGCPRVVSGGPLGGNAHTSSFSSKFAILFKMLLLSLRAFCPLSLPSFSARALASSMLPATLIHCLLYKAAGFPSLYIRNEVLSSPSTR